jgi:hypothetical protein
VHAEIPPEGAPEAVSILRHQSCRSVGEGKAKEAKATELILDFEATDDRVHGNQERAAARRMKYAGSAVRR